MPLKWGAAGGANGALTGVVPIDLDISIPSDYEQARVAGASVIRLKHHTDLSFLAADTDIADGASPPAGWSWDNAAKATSATGNPTGASGECHIVANGAQRWWSGTETAAFFHRQLTGWDKGARVVARLAYEQVSGSYENESGFHVMIYDGNSNVHYAGINYESGAHKVRGGDFNDKGVLATTSQAINEAGVWFMIQYDGKYVRQWYDTTDDPLPPHLRSTPGTWTKLNDADQASSMTGACELGFVLNGFNNASADHTAKVLYFSYEPGAGDHVDGMVDVNFGTTTGSPAIQLVQDFDLGADSVLTDGDLQTALAAAINNLPADAATWTFTAVRDASTGAAAGTYAAAGSATVEGSGRYFNLWGKCNSDGTQTGSIDADFTVAFADS